jgi:four helix bundle protein
MKDPLNNYIVYIKASKFYDNVVKDTNKLLYDVRSIEITKQLFRSAGSICATIEEGYGRGSTKEFLRYLRISRGSARETKGWYIRSKHFLDKNLINTRLEEIDENWRPKYYKLSPLSPPLFSFDNVSKV